MPLKDVNTYELLLNNIRERVPNKTKLANLLTDILSIEKEAVYRRLRGEVAFTFAEIVKISRALNISLDNIVGINSPVSYPFQLKLTKYFNPTETDYNMLDEFTDIIVNIRPDEYSEFAFAAGVIPAHFTIKHSMIHRFYVMRFLYQFDDPGDTPPLSEIVFDDRMSSILNRYLVHIENLKYTYFIWDEWIIVNLTNDIKYFHSIRLITDEEVQLLKKEIMRFLDDLELLAIHGKFPSGNKVDLYVSSLNFETSYTYLQTEQYRVTMMKSFTICDFSSLNEEIFNKMKSWFQGLKRTSVLISGSNERSRIRFFEKQRDILQRELP